MAQSRGVMRNTELKRQLQKRPLKRLSATIYLRMEATISFALLFAVHSANAVLPASQYYSIRAEKGHDEVNSASSHIDLTIGTRCSDARRLMRIEWPRRFLGLRWRHRRQRCPR